ncbi:hypothetical protein [Streptomyces glaucus]|uniref:hypothetical protein n=1 Tax=Streptomyces glaucus TaxID=284029 RepID=UPI0031DE319B
MLERTRTAERYTRGFTAAVIAVTALLLAAYAGPGGAAKGEPVSSGDSAVTVRR